MPRNGKIVGVDIGTFAVKAAWAEPKGGRMVVTRTETLRLPPEVADRSTVVAPWIEKMGLGKSPCAISLPGGHSMFQPFTLPKDDARTLEQAAAIEVLKFNEMASEVMVSDFSPFSSQPDVRQFLLAMARPTMVDETLSFARDVGLQVQDIIPAPVAAFAAATPHLPPSGPPVVVMDIGHGATNVAIGTSKGLMFARTFASGGRLFTDALARQRNLPSTQAENLKQTEGSLRADGTDTADTLRGVADSWIAEAQSCLAVYRSLFPGQSLAPHRVILSGGGASLPGLAEYASVKLNLGVTLAETIVPGGNAAESLPSMIAAGLATAGHGTDRISLLPQGIRDELAFRRQKPFWVGASIAGALILGVSLAGGYHYSTRQQEVLKEQSKSLQRMEALVVAIENEKARAAQVRRLAQPIRELVGAGVTVRDLVTLVADSTATNDWITLACDAESYFSNEPFVPGSDAAIGMRDRRRKPEVEDEQKDQTRIERMIIEGYTSRRSLSSIKRLIARLEDSDLVESADLLSDDQLVGPDRPGPGRAQRVVLDVRLAQP